MQESADVELIVLNDQSEDSTGDILSQLQREYPSLQVLTGTPLPKGWVGKSWACHNLAQHATGDILVFTDADTLHSHNLIARVVAFMQEHNLQMLSLIPYQRMTSLAEHIIVPMIHVIFYATWLNIHLIRKWTTTPAAAIGQFIAFTRQGYNAIGGHTSVRTSLVEDVFLAKAAQQQKLRYGLIDGTDAIECHMYTSITEAAQGFSKNLFPAMRHNIFTMMFFVLQQLVVYVLPIPLLIIALSCSMMPAAALSASAIMFTMLIRYTIASTFRMPVWHAFIQPITAVLCIAIGVNSVRWAYSSAGARWKGRSYTGRNS
jgi:chlorobactene glucosyltransferase